MSAIIWRCAGAVSALAFVASAGLFYLSDLSYLWVVACVGAAFLGMQTLRAKPLPRWPMVVVVVITTELLLLSVFYPTSGHIRTLGSSTLIDSGISRAAVALAVVAWSTALAMLRPFVPEGEAHSRVW